MEKCSKCGKEQDGFLSVDVDQDRQGNYITGAACSYCHEIQWIDDDSVCNHPSVDWQKFCTSCGRYVGGR